MRKTEQNNRPNELRFFIKKVEESVFFAVCLEHYIGAQGSTVEEVKKRLMIAYRAELDESMSRTGKPFGGIPAAPAEYQQMYSSDDRHLMRGTIRDEDGDYIGLAA